MEAVSFNNMSDGTREEYEFLDALEAQFVEELPDRILEHLRLLENSVTGYKVNRLDHSLQSATRAYRAGEPEELVVAALLHDIGDLIASLSHSEMAAAVLRPFVSDKIYWIVKHHGLFQMFYYAHYTGGDRDARDKYLGHPWYEDAVKFCEEYDQNCFNPDYESEPLEFFEPMLRRLFQQKNVRDFESDARYGNIDGS